MSGPKLSIPINDASILSRIKEAYLSWIIIVPHIPRSARYTIGTRIENKFLDLLELSYTAYFTERARKEEKIDECILVLDTLKFLISIAWEGRLVANNQHQDISLVLDEVGKMFGGWKKNLQLPSKKNRAR